MIGASVLQEHIHREVEEGTDSSRDPQGRGQNIKRVGKPKGWLLRAREGCGR